MLRDGAIYIVSRAIPAVLGFATAMLLTWLLPPGAYGRYGLGMAVVMLTHSVLFEWLAACLLRWYGTHEDKPDFMPTILMLFAGICLAAALVLALASVTGLTGHHTAFAWVLIFGTVAYGWFDFASRLQVCRSQPMRYLYMTLLRNALILGGGAMIAHLTQSAEATLLISFVGMAIAGCLFVSRGGPRLPRGRFDPALARDFLPYGIPVGLTMTFGGLATSATPIMIGSLSGYEAVGAYTVSYTIVQSTIGVIATGFSAATYPGAVRVAESGNLAAARDNLARIYKVLLMLLLPAGVGLALLASEIGGVFVDPHYHEAMARTMPWLAAAAVMMGLRNTYVDYAFHLGKRTGFLFQIIALAGSLNLGLGALLIPGWGSVGAAIAITVAFGVALIHGAILARRAYPLPLPRKETLGVVLATAFMAVAVEATPAPPGLLGLLLSVATGVAAYAVALVALAALALAHLPQGAGAPPFTARLRHALTLPGREP